MRDSPGFGLLLGSNDRRDTEMFEGIASSILPRRYRRRKAQTRAASPCGCGNSGGNPREAFFDVVDQVAVRERVATYVAMATVRDMCPDLFRAAFPAEALHR